jgi:hypothetical protein
MSRADISYAVRNPHNATRIDVLASVVEQRVEQLVISGEIPGGLEGLEDGSGDAVRHAAFMCAVTRLVGADEAEVVGTNHEDVENNPDARRAMDLANNAVGRRLGTETKGDCVKAAAAALPQLSVIKR